MRTANDPIDLRGVRESLDELKSAIGAAVAGESTVHKAKAERYSALRRDAMRHSESEEEKLASRLGALSQEFERKLMEHERRVESRKSWIQRAYHASRDVLAQKIQHSRDRKIGQVQGEIMRARQARQEEYEREVARHREFHARIKEDRVLRHELRNSVLASLRTYRPLIGAWFYTRVAAAGGVEAGKTAEETRGFLIELQESCRQLAAVAARQPVARLFRFLPLWLVSTVVLVLHVWLGLRSGGAMTQVIPSLVVSELLLLVIWCSGLAMSWRVARKAADSLRDARALEIAAERQSDAWFESCCAGFKEAKTAEARDLGDTFRETEEEWKERMAEGRLRLELQYARLPGRLERFARRAMGKLNAAHQQAVDRARHESELRKLGFRQIQDGLKAAIDAEASGGMDALALEWRNSVIPLRERLEDLRVRARSVFPAWSHEYCANWEPPVEVAQSIRIGAVDVELDVLAGGMPADPRFSGCEEGSLSIPFALEFPEQASILLESDGSDDGASVRVLSTVALRVLASHPPGRASFVFIDPVGLGREFGGLMHLADYEESLIHHRVWTQPSQIEERLAELNEHMEKVIQMYLRDEYPNLDEYNRYAGSIAEKRRFLVVAGFPFGFSDVAAKRLLAIASSGARCGVHVLIQRDLRQNFSDITLEHELRRTCIRVVSGSDGFRLADAPAGADVVVFDSPPSHQDSISLVHRIGRASIDSNRVQVPFSQVAPQDAEVWSADTTDELRVPIGRTGAKKLQMLALGKGTRQHMLVAGKTGSGKSTLFHVIITNLALWCSPDQVEFYLVDFKKGVEFKCYASRQLPHARVIAIESDREFALSVLQRVDGELKRRGEMFRRAGAQDLAGYKRSSGAERMPRTLLLIDEFQEFFTEDDPVAQEAALLLDRIVRQGRAFGIHVILGSQTLGGAYTLARATLGQMVVRVALQCNEADAHLIMDDDNPAPRMLSRPGEGIYNDQAGMHAANSPFQIVWLPEDERDAVLDRVAALAADCPALPEPPVVFEGNAPADVLENHQLNRLATVRPSERPSKPGFWLGAPNSIKGHTEAVFQRQSGSHLLVVGQSAERSLALLSIALVSLAAQHPPGTAEFVVVDPQGADDAGAEPFRRLLTAIPHRVRLCGPTDLSGVFGSLGEQLAARTPDGGKGEPEVFVLVHQLQRFKGLRPEDDFRFAMDDGPVAASPSKVFSDLLGEGASCGMHVIVSVDGWNNVSRWIPRKLMGEFEMRVLFQMSANDSSNLIDSPAASSLGLHRALLYNEHLGSLETFRPYALPSDDWLERIARVGDGNEG